MINKIAIIGAGNMGGAIAKGIVASKTLRAEQISLSRKDPAKLDEYRKLGFGTEADNCTVVKGADLIIIAVKPYMVGSIAKEIAPVLKAEQGIISVAANVSIQELEECFGEDKQIYRIIPNTAIAIRESLSCIVPNKAGKANIKPIDDLFAALGEVHVIDEELVPAATALASCGTAFAMRYLHAAMKGGIEMGLKAPVAKQMAAQTVKGAAMLLLANEDSHPEQEIDKVCTPAGITIKGLNELDHCGFSSAVIKSLLESYHMMKK